MEDNTVAMGNEKNWDKLLQINTIGRDETNADEHHYPYEPTDYPVLERLVDSGFFSEGDVVLDYGCGTMDPNSAKQKSFH